MNLIKIIDNIKFEIFYLNISNQLFMANPL